MLVSELSMFADCKDQGAILYRDGASYWTVAKIV
jgi:hypothetical protein